MPLTFWSLMNGGSYLISCSDNSELDMNSAFFFFLLLSKDTQCADTRQVSSSFIQFHSSNDGASFFLSPKTWVEKETAVRCTGENSGPLLHRVICFDTDAAKRSRRAASHVHRVRFILFWDDWNNEVILRQHTGQIRSDDNNSTKNGCQCRKTPLLSLKILPNKPAKSIRF